MEKTSFSYIYNLEIQKNHLPMDDNEHLPSDAEKYAENSPSDEESDFNEWIFLQG